MVKSPRKKTQRLLVPVDGSDRSMNTVRSIAKFAPFHSMEVVLFHVFNKVPECYYDLSREPKSIRTAPQVRAWEREYKKSMVESMQTARGILYKAGFPESAVEVCIRNRKKGIARDIIREAGNGYDAVVTRRRGMGAMPQVVMGSIATKLVENLTFIPVLVMGRKPVNNRILIGVDGSENALQAVEFVGKTVAGHPVSLGLFHASRGFSPFVSGNEVVENCPDSDRETVASIFRSAQARLLKCGIPEDAVQTKAVTGVVSRAGAIAEEAGRGEYSTIVMGRKGVSRIRDFFMGRVSTKVLHAARNHSVWVVT